MSYYEFYNDCLLYQVAVKNFLRVARKLVIRNVGQVRSYLRVQCFREDKQYNLFDKYLGHEIATRAGNLSSRRERSI